MLALRWQAGYFRYILAVTFANKATQEMKDRILLYLDQFARGITNNLSEEIKTELQLSDRELQSKSKEVLSAILHSYSQFSISTIDSFFQRVIRSFTREAGLLGNFRLEVDNDRVLAEVIDEVMVELGKDEELTQWVVQFSRDKLLEGKNWNTTVELQDFAKEIFREQFKEVEEEILQESNDPATYKKILRELQKEVGIYRQTMKAKAVKALKIVSDHRLSVNDFKNKNSGTAFRYFSVFANEEYYDSSKARIQSSLTDSKEWFDQKRSDWPQLRTLVESQLMPALRDMVDYDQRHYSSFKSAEVVLKNFYAFGLLTYITKKLREYKDQNNVMLLSDAPSFLNKIIGDTDTPFVYEKVGSLYRHYLIDEFQDTSGYQWKNFLPLVKDSLDSGRKNLVVGDVKQSIYRWRGSDPELLQSKVVGDLGHHEADTQPLPQNFRSASNIVKFNNTLFEEAAKRISELVESPLHTNVFDDVQQQVARPDVLGFVHVEFLEKREDIYEAALEELPGWLEKLQDNGVALSDIAFLVRRNDEGQRIASYLLTYQQIHSSGKYRYDVVSNESLRLDTCSSVNLIISALQYLQNPVDAIAKAQLLYEVTKEKATDAGLFEHINTDRWKENLPTAFWERELFLRKLSVFELTEEIIRLFELGKDDSELAYLHAFQDLALEFSGQEKNDVNSFLTWWADNKDKEKASIKVSGNVNAATILTIHKAKGLQFRFVLVPFCDWSLNHGRPPLMWVRSDAPPFNTMGPLAVQYSSSLEKTVFAEAYTHERSLAYLDNLNILYVALTRAEEGMIVMAPLPPEKGRKISTAGALLAESIHGNATLSASFDGRIFKMGSLQPYQPKASEHSTISLDHYYTTDWRDRLLIKNRGTEFFSDETEKRSKINYGILVHQVLARIHYKSEAEKALDKFMREGEWGPTEKETIQTLVMKVLEHSRLAPFFGKPWIVRTEEPVLLPGGREHRFDRVVTHGNRAVIIDYKTGKKKSSDREQMEAYAMTLTKMGYAKVEGCLVYLGDEIELVEVIDQSG
ncbi:MAG: UvrD-helicase domain-containing protein, partial [Cyclobacteriaceae bacterium]|nr:UvrD-helicase domain-containing protein [Cyclobacteriaceae bacterium]